MQVQLSRDEIEAAVGNYLRLMFNPGEITVKEITVGRSGQSVTAEIEMNDLGIRDGEGEG